MWLTRYIKPCCKQESKPIHFNFACENSYCTLPCIDQSLLMALDFLQPVLQHGPASGILIYDRSEGNAKMNLTDKERLTIQAMERIGASFSLVGIAFIIFAYAIFKRARTVPNTFILFASIANLGASIACLIGSAGLTDGSSSALCQTQAFLLEMQVYLLSAFCRVAERMISNSNPLRFMQSDPWWSFAMAVNVYMIFFMAYHPSHRHMWFYCIICFGVPAIPATICLLYSPNGSKIYGDATVRRLHHSQSTTTENLR